MQRETRMAPQSGPAHALSDERRALDLADALRIQVKPADLAPDMPADLASRP
jgi:hypothetical protein